MAKALEEAGVFKLLERSAITRMPRPPSPDDGEQQCTVEISSDEEDQEDDESSPSARESRNDPGTVTLNMDMQM